MAGFDPFSVIGDLAGKIVDLFPNPADKLKAQELQAQMQSAILDAQTKFAQAQSSVLVAEAQSQSWLARNWRPMAMVNCFLLIDVRIIGAIFGVTFNGVSADEWMKLWTLVTVGLGGYIVGRSGEKMMNSYANGNASSNDSKT